MRSLTRHFPKLPLIPAKAGIHACGKIASELQNQLKTVDPAFQRGEREEE